MFQLLNLRQNGPIHVRIDTPRVTHWNGKLVKNAPGGPPCSYVITTCICRNVHRKILHKSIEHAITARTRARAGQICLEMVQRGTVPPPRKHHHKNITPFIICTVKIYNLHFYASQIHPDSGELLIFQIFRYVIANSQ